MIKIVFVGIGVLGIAGLGVFFALRNSAIQTEIPADTTQEPAQQKTPQPAPSTVEPAPAPITPQHTLKNEQPTNNQQNQLPVIWSFNGSAWFANATPPNCTNPFTIQTPVDITKVTAALWPGQVRGDYKAHGGFRFADTENNAVTVRAPVDSHLVQASQYLSNGDKQYLLFFSVPCGYFYRFDHIRELPTKLQAAVQHLPPPVEGESKTTRLNPPVWIEQGEIVGTSVGIFPANIFVDFGLYDVRKPNNITPNPMWANLYEKDVEFGHYGVCFFDYLPKQDGQTMRSLPTGKEGKTSDYCK